MCVLTEKTPRGTKIVGWKVVAVDLETGDYYSPAMGCKYTSGKRVPIVKQQQSIDMLYGDHILELYYHETNVGRTNIFINLEDAKRGADINYCDMRDGFDVKVVKAEVSCSVMLGFYDGGSEVAGGRIITFLEEEE